MDQTPNPSSKHLEEPKPKFPLVFPAITNLAIIALFFCTFCHIKTCSGNYKPVSGMQLAQRSVQAAFRDPRPAFILSPVPITLGAAILSLVFCLGDPQKLEKRTSISGMVGGFSISAFILLCLLIKAKLGWAPMLIAILHFANPLARFFRPKPKLPSTE